jgi:hypothetical protein
MIRNSPEEEYDMASRREQYRQMVSLENRFPGVTAAIEHETCVFAAQEGKTNIRKHWAPIIGGWGAWLTLYAPELDGYSQNFQLHNNGGYPERFKNATDAREACEKEEPELMKQYINEIKK